MIDPDGRKPLIANQYRSLDELKKAVDIQYTPGGYETRFTGDTYTDVYIQAKVSVTDKSGKGTNELSEATVVQKEASDKLEKGSTWDKLMLALQYPDAAYFKGELEEIRKLAKATKDPKGKIINGTAIGHMSDLMYEHLAMKDRPSGRTVMIGKDKTTMKGATKNMMLHVFGQALLTTLYGRSVADLAGDIHERDQPSLITGVISKAEERQAIDNYADLVNNLYGQDIGERLQKELGATENTVWTPELTAKYLNAVQLEIEKEMKWTFKPFDAKTPEVVRFTDRLNEVTGSKARQELRRALQSQPLHGH